jgi:putative hemolysin
MACVVVVAAMGVGVDAQAQSPPQLANPASQNCAAKGGTLRIEQRPDGGQYGVCVFVDNYQCEEWALFRGECPVGGLRVTGYVTPAARYCAITGGRYAVVAKSGAADEQGACALPGGKDCDAASYYAGSCRR